MGRCFSTVWLRQGSTWNCSRRARHRGGTEPVSPPRGQRPEERRCFGVGGESCPEGRGGRPQEVSGVHWCLPQEERVPHAIYGGL